MTIDRSGKWWRGSNPNDIEEYLSEYTADSYPTNEFRHCRCRCNGETFLLWSDDDEGAAKRQCAWCGEFAFVGDSGEYWGEASPEAWRCVECGSAHTNVGVGFSVRATTQAFAGFTWECVARSVACWAALQGERLVQVICRCWTAHGATPAPVAACVAVAAGFGRRP